MKDDSIYLMHIRDALGHILDYTTEGKDSFFEDTKTEGCCSLEFRDRRGGGQESIAAVQG